MLTNRPYHQKINRIVVRCWLMDLLISIVLYIAYRLTIMNITADGTGFLANVLFILNILLDLAFSLIYLVGMVVCSFTIFLNNLKKVRDNKFFSWSSFSGIPMLLSLALVVTFYQDAHLHKVDMITKLLLFSAMYVIITTMLFWWFQRRYHALMDAQGDGKIQETLSPKR